jgi:Zn-dependent M28 family amino/carboxypeptidase
MLGGHLDSWESGTGATDNAAGVAVCMEAVRILQELKIRPRRTIRIALWSGEEQGLFGSRAYVKEHFGGLDDSPEGFAASLYRTMFSGERPTPELVTTKEHDKLSAYFNLDNGTGKIRGVYLEGNEAVRPIFRRWLEPFRDLGASTLSASATGGTDHMAFDAVGLPGFQFIQDPVEYETRTHHSNMDTYERLQADDLKQASTILAALSSRRRIATKSCRGRGCRAGDAGPGPGAWSGRGTAHSASIGALLFERARSSRRFRKLWMRADSSPVASRSSA